MKTLLFGSGLRKKDNLIQNRFYKGKVPYGPTEGYKVNYNDYLKILREYYGFARME